MMMLRVQAPETTGLLFLQDPGVITCVVFRETGLFMVAFSLTHENLAIFLGLSPDRRFEPGEEFTLFASGVPKPA